MKDPFASIVRRVLRYNFEDGTSELMAGLLFFWIGFFFKPLPEPDVPNGIAILGIVLAIFLIAWIKQSYVYPRSGYVNTARFSGNIKQTLSLLLGGLLLAIIIAIFLVGPVLLFGSGGWIILPTGLVMGLLFAFLGIRLGFPRLIFVALISGGLAILCSPLMFGVHRYVFSSTRYPYWVVYPEQIFMFAYFLLMGLSLTISGSQAFLNYLQQNPIPKEILDEQ